MRAGGHGPHRLAVCLSFDFLSALLEALVSGCFARGPGLIVRASYSEPVHRGSQTLGIKPARPYARFRGVETGSKQREAH